MMILVLIKADSSPINLIVHCTSFHIDSFSLDSVLWCVLYIHIIYLYIYEGLLIRSFRIRFLFFFDTPIDF